MYSHATPPPKTYTPVPASAFGGEVPPAQAARLSMQRALLHGVWGTWAKGSLSAHTLLPQGTMLKMGVCVAGGDCAEDATKSMNDGDDVRLGPHAYDRSYTQLYFNYKGVNVSLETSQVGGPGGHLIALATPVDPAAAAAKKGGLWLAGFMADDQVPGAKWRLHGNVSVSAGGSSAAGISFQVAGKWSPDASSRVAALVVAPAGTVVTAGTGAVADSLFVPFGDGIVGGGAVGFTTGAGAAGAATVASLRAQLDSARDAELATYAWYTNATAGVDLAHAKEASQSGMPCHH